MEIIVLWIRNDLFRIQRMLFIHIWKLYQLQSYSTGTTVPVLQSRIFIYS